MYWPHSTLVLQIWRQQVPPEGWSTELHHDNNIQNGLRYLFTLTDRLLVYRLENFKLILVLVSDMKEFTAAYWTQQEKCMNKGNLEIKQPAKTPTAKK